MQTILVTSTGGTVGGLIVQMIRDALPADTQLIAADATVGMFKTKGADHMIELPMANDPTYETALQGAIRQHGVDTVLPLSEEECLKVSLMDQQQTLGARYMGMPHDTLRTITDKIKCAEALTAAGIDVPRSVPLSTLDAFETQLTEFGYPDTPVVLKPISARGSRGFRVIDAQTDRLAEFQRKGGPIFMDSEQAIDTFRANPAALKEYFLMEFLSGDSVSVDLVAWNGQALGIFPHFRLGYKWGFVDHARIARDPEIEAYCEAVIGTLGMHGLCNIEVGYRSDGSLSLIEVNGRTSATAAQNTLLGANSLELLLRAEAGDVQRFQFEDPVIYRTLTDYIQVA